MDAVEELDDPVHREPEVDLEEAWERRRAAFAATLPTLVVTVRVPVAHRAELAAAALSIAAERPARPDHLQVEVSFGDRSHAERVLWRFGDTVEVLAPASLRDAIAGRAAAVAALYT